MVDIPEEDLKQVYLGCALPLQEINARYMARRIRSITPLYQTRRQVTPAMETMVRELLADFSTPLVLISAIWGAVANNSWIFLLLSDASVDGFPVTPSNTSKTATTFTPIVFISRAATDYERPSTPLELEEGRIVWILKLLRGHTCWVPNSDCVRTTRDPKSVDKLA